jgi:hypothetical protein
MPNLPPKTFLETRGEQMQRDLRAIYQPYAGSEYRQNIRASDETEDTYQLAMLRLVIVIDANHHSLSALPGYQNWWSSWNLHTNNSIIAGAPAPVMEAHRDMQQKDLQGEEAKEKEGQRLLEVRRALTGTYFTALREMVHKVVEVGQPLAEVISPELWKTRLDSLVKTIQEGFQPYVEEFQAPSGPRRATRANIVFSWMPDDYSHYQWKQFESGLVNESTVPAHGGGTGPQPTEIRIADGMGLRRHDRALMPHTLMPGREV